MFDSQSLYGCAPQLPTSGIAAPTAHMGTDGITSGAAGLLDPHNPLVWFGALLLVTVGMASAAGSVRLGKATATVGLGK